METKTKIQKKREKRDNQIIELYMQLTGMPKTVIYENIADKMDVSISLVQKVLRRVRVGK